MDVSPTQDRDCQNVVRSMTDIDALLADVQAAIDNATAAIYEQRPARDVLAALVNARRAVVLTRRDLQGGGSCF